MHIVLAKRRKAYNWSSNPLLSQSVCSRKLCDVDIRSLGGYWRKRS